MRLILMALMLVSVAGSASAAPRSTWPGPFPVEILAVRDGDTVEVRFIDGPCGRGPCPRQELLVRLLGIDAPEIHRCRRGASGQAASGGASCAACDAEWQLARKAVAAVRQMTAGKAVRVAAIRPDKYGGRVVGRLEVLSAGRWVSVGGELTSQGLAVAYDGGKKIKTWCAAPSSNT